MQPEAVGRLELFVESLTGVPWFANAGQSDPRYHVVPDAVVGWDDWTHQMVAVWTTRSEQLERIAQDRLGDPAITSISIGCTRHRAAGEERGQGILRPEA